MNTVTLYYKDGSPECDQVKAHLESLQPIFPHQLVQIDVNSDADLFKAFAHRVPIVQIGPYRLEGTITREQLQVSLGAAKDRSSQLEKVDQKSYQERISKGRTITGSDRLSLWISKNYIHAFNVLMFVYLGLPFLAPVLLKNGIDAPANLIYRFYSIMCHQLPFRSFFLFGEQPYYPRALAGVPGAITYEQISGKTTIDVFNDRWFEGNPVVGYKVALCERDVAMYAAMLIFGLVFAATGKRIRSIPWYLWVLIGLGPIGLDGFSQLPSVIPGLPSWLPMRESTPFLRTLTGGLFGVMTTWYLYPMIEDTMKETRNLITHKLAIAVQLGSAQKQP
jgi:uncharacterized membrane protein